MRDGLQDGSQRLEPNRHVKQMSREEEVVEVSHHREGEVPKRVQERVVGEGDARLPHLVAPVDADDARNSSKSYMILINRTNLSE